MISVRGLTAGYVSDVPIIRDVTLEVSDRTIVTLLGPNGSGKSTLLKAIMGYLRPMKGEILIDGAPMASIPVHDRSIKLGVAYVPQRENVFGPLSVRENLNLGGARLPRRKRRERVEELLDLYPILGERLGQRADSQSGGERQMLAIARALMTSPRCLLLDEPSVGLSPLMLGRVFEMLAELRSRDGVTVLVVEQNAAESLAVSDRGIVLVLGEIAIEGSADELLDDPRVSQLYLGGTPALEAEQVATATTESVH